MTSFAARTSAASLILVPALIGSALTPAMAAPTPPPSSTPGRPSVDARFTPGAAGAGDPYFPKAGNGGYDGIHYDIKLRYEPGKRRISGTTTITAFATQNLSRFDLDFVGNTVRRVTVGNAPAAHRRDGQELIVTPREGIRKGTTFTVAVTYDGSPDGKDHGWIRTSDGAVALSQPEGSATWFPLNDHPSDKATHAYEITAPAGLQVLANGEPVGRPRADERQATLTHRWRSRQPMAGYLAMVAIGKFRVSEGRSPRGIRTISAVDESLMQDLNKLQQVTGEVTDWGVRMFGRYPFDSTGGIIDNVAVGYALETQNRPVYPGITNVPLIVHEVAHQWFGDSVTVRRWQDIWLNEGFASYAEWLWSEQHKGRTAAQTFAEQYKQADANAWKARPGMPGPKGMFSNFPIYTRGAMTLHALRTTVGDAAFFQILRTWATQRAHGHATTQDFIAHAERVSRRQLDGLFQQWLFKSGRPALPKADQTPIR